MANNGLLARFLSGEHTLEQFQRRIEELEPRLHAWVELRLEDPPPAGPLAGAPYGAKDIVDAAGYCSTFGSALYAANRAAEDAALIRLLRARGGRLMGKTQTTSFAYFDPAPTRNPRSPGHTPGGSSSGSAAAVATGMVPFAIGSQTQGSILRPASFCGVVGFKPTFGVLPLEGIMPFAPSLDTAGFFTQSALDMRTLWQALGFAVDAELPPAFGMIELEVEPEMQEMFRHSLQILSHYGCRIHRFPLPETFRKLPQAVTLLQKYEGARTHRDKFERHGTAIGVKLAQLIREGLDLPESQYQEALALVARARAEMAPYFAEFPVLLSAAAPGPPPQGLGSTGDPRCNAPFTGLHTPALAVPMPVGEQLPMGLQMAAAPGQDATLIAAACHVHALLSAGAE